MTVCAKGFLIANILNLSFGDALVSFLKGMNFEAVVGVELTIGFEFGLNSVLDTIYLRKSSFRHCPFFISPNVSLINYRADDRRRKTRFQEVNSIGNFSEVGTYLRQRPDPYLDLNKGGWNNAASQDHYISAAGTIIFRELVPRLAVWPLASFQFAYSTKTWWCLRMSSLAMSAVRMYYVVTGPPWKSVTSAIRSLERFIPARRASSSWISKSTRDTNFLAISFHNNHCNSIPIVTDPMHRGLSGLRILAQVQ
jgi:hypothetical protein